MAVNYIEIDTGQLDRDIRELRENIDRSAKEMESMVQEIEEMNAMWSGKANMAFRTQFANDVQKMQGLLEKLNKLAECMEYASAEYVKCEGEVRNMVDEIRI